MRLSAILITTLLTSQAWGQDTTYFPLSANLPYRHYEVYKQPDTLAVYVIFQPYPGSAITAKDAYLIKGQLWYRSVAALNKGKWFPFRKNWRVIEIKQSK